jgi:hypothetical protein
VKELNIKISLDCDEWGIGHRTLVLTVAEVWAREKLLPLTTKQTQNLKLNLVNKFEMAAKPTLT